MEIAGSEEPYDEKQPMVCFDESPKQLIAEIRERVHGSCLNMDEMEFSVLARICLAGRVPDEVTLRRRINANVAERNAEHHPINWRFTIRDAPNKLHRLYPSTAAY
jgi:hypothetical protein